jgi:two-component system CheB/CheR fusion protein
MEEEALGQPVSTIFTPEDIKKGADKAERRQAAETRRAEDEREHIRKEFIVCFQ